MFLAHVRLSHAGRDSLEHPVRELLSVEPLGYLGQVPHERAVIEFGYLAERRPNLSVDRGWVCVGTEAQTGVPERKPLDRIPMRETRTSPPRRSRTRRQRPRSSAIQGARPPRPPGRPRPRLSYARGGLVAHAGGIEHRDLGPFLELWPYHPLQLAIARDEEQPRPGHPRTSSLSTYGSLSEVLKRRLLT